MYITASTYGGIDWHDSRTILEQLKNNGSFNIKADQVPETIADDIAKDFPYVENIREKINPGPAGSLRKILLSVYD